MHIQVTIIIFLFLLYASYWNASEKNENASTYIKGELIYEDNKS